jgi:hypothetical protein
MTDITGERHPPVFTRPPTAAARRRLDWSWLAIPLLLVALLLQVAIADRANLAADRDWRPRIATLCALLGCSIPPWREPAALHVTSRDLRPHPTLPGVLVVSATFRNDAPFAQPWPQLRLSLQNLDA